MELFYQVFDKGFMEDAEGREVDFRNTVIFMTSNAGSDFLMKVCANAQNRPDPEELVRMLGPELREIFKPALLGRTIVIPFYPIHDDSLRLIVKIKLDQISERLRANHGLPFTYSDDLVSEIARRCTEVESGARNIDHILTGTLLPEVSSEILARMANGSLLSGVHVTVGGGELRYEVT
jgi:type VI secretion system protein VasG